uniref:CDAN1 interacting nuclease 1 n=1 Tax=Saimiri boliviensis boliviensis TaxID=39432 RepID=A0A2K6UGC4_SAIBB
MYQLSHLLVRIYPGARLQPGKGHPAQSLFPYEHCHFMPQHGLTLKILEEKLGGKASTHLALCSHALMETQHCITVAE